jgi:hypothetical protein
VTSIFWNIIYEAIPNARNILVLQAAYDTHIQRNKMYMYTRFMSIPIWQKTIPRFADRSSSSSRVLGGTQKVGVSLFFIISNQSFLESFLPCHNYYYAVVCSESGWYDVIKVLHELVLVSSTKEHAVCCVDQ